MINWKGDRLRIDAIVGRITLGHLFRWSVFVQIVLVGAVPLSGADWTQFRGLHGAAISHDSQVPTQWSGSKNLLWKTELPGPGSSSPIVLGEKVFITCYSGYGDGSDGRIDDLTRHLVCIDRKTGDVVWDKPIDVELPEDPYTGFIQEHGYASSTPVTDGERVYVFFGKTGVLAFDLKGNQLWQVSVGKESSNRRWGSAASPILYKDTVIVNASEESQSIRALDKESGEEVWRAEGSVLDLSYSTPALAQTSSGAQLILTVPGEIWGLNPANGKLAWYVTTQLTGNISPSVVVHDGIAYAFGGYRGSGSLAIRLGGDGDVADSHVVWSSRNSSYVPSPVYHDGHLYYVDENGVANCIDAKTGESVKRTRLQSTTGRLSGRNPFYASVVLINGKLFAVSRRSGTFVISADPEMQQKENNVIPGDDSDFNASPAVSDGQLFLRSNRFLYCVGQLQSVRR